MLGATVKRLTALEYERGDRLAVPTWGIAPPPRTAAREPFQHAEGSRRVAVAPNAGRRSSLFLAVFLNNSRIALQDGEFDALHRASAKSLAIFFIRPF